MTYDQIEKLQSKNEVRECIDKMEHITLTMEIIMNNLIPKINLDKKKENSPPQKSLRRKSIR